MGDALRPSCLVFAKRVALRAGTPAPIRYHALPVFQCVDRQPPVRPCVPGHYQRPFLDRAGRRVAERRPPAAPRGLERKSLLILGLSLLTVGISDPVCNRLIKPAVHRLRPCNPEVDIPGGRFLIGRKTSHSFPSSHAMNMFAQAALFSFFYRKRAAWFFLFAAIIGFSRIYVGVHYPLDVLGGAVFGMCVGALVYGGYRAIFFQIEHRRKKIITF